MKIIFSDMDGTFLDAEKQVTDESWTALDELARQGIGFVPCTGRPLSGIYPEMLAHPAVQYAVSANGATVSRLDADRPGNPAAATPIMSHPLAREAALAVWDVARSHDVTFDIFADGACYLRRDLYERLGEFDGGDPAIGASLKRTRIAVDEEPDVTLERVETLERVAMYWHNPTDRDAILQKLQNIDGIEITRSYPMNIEVMGAGVSKGSALTWLCRHLGIDTAEAVAFGDNINDIPMIQAAGLGIAMKNAEPEDREAADLITRYTYKESGVARCIQELLAKGR